MSARAVGRALAKQDALKPPHPGDVLREYIERERPDLTQDQLADALGVSRISVNQLFNGKRDLTHNMALRLSTCFSTSAEFWLNLQGSCDLWNARQFMENSGQLARVQVLRTPENAKPPFVEHRT